jgi:phage repressor protein C with HTH and peptisase S24 domain
LLWDEEGLRADVEDRISRPYDVPDRRAIAVRVRGDSMVPRYNPGDEVIVSPSSDVEDGNGVFVKLRTGERLLKIARRAQGGWILESENRTYPARFVKKSEVETMHPIVWIRPARRGRGDRKGQ